MHKRLRSETMKEKSFERTPKVFESEYRFCLILWENEPLKAAELAKICKEKLEWSRTTTYNRPYQEIS